MEGKHSGKQPEEQPVRRIPPEQRRPAPDPQSEEPRVRRRPTEPDFEATEPVRQREASPAHKKKKRRKKTPLLQVILGDILLMGLVLCLFASFHHVIPRLTAKSKAGPTPVQITKTTPEPAAPQETTPATTVSEAEPTPTPEPTAEPTPEPTPEPTWREKFAEHFTEEVVVTDHSYTSPNVSITISDVRTEYTDVAQTNLHIADIYIADIECFKTCFAYGEFGYYAAENALNLSSRANAIVAINGDYADNQLSGFLVRNGELYYDEYTTFDICVLYYDGTMETYDAGSYNVEEILERQPYQSFKFGPALLDNGVAKTRFNCSNEIAVDNPRAAVGFYEPGHYCFVVADGRQGNSRGLEIQRLAKLFEDLGCVSAYNLDGGASAVMTFNGSRASNPSNGGRDLGDILLITEPVTGEEG